MTSEALTTTFPILTGLDLSGLTGEEALYCALVYANTRRTSPYNGCDSSMCLFGPFDLTFGTLRIAANAFHVNVGTVMRIWFTAADHGANLEASLANAARRLGLDEARAEAVAARTRSCARQTAT